MKKHINTLSCRTSSRRLREKNEREDCARARYGIYFMLSLCLLITSCSSDDAPVDQESLLPPITQTGENTFGCLIDGKYFRPRDGRPSLQNDNKGLFTIRTEDDNWEIDISDRKSDITTSMLIHIENLFENNVGIEGRYDLGEANGFKGIDGPDHSYIYCRTWNKESNSYETYLSRENSGHVFFLHLENGPPNTYSIHSATFEAVLYNRESPLDSIVVSSGRFDLDTVSLRFETFD